MWEYGREQSFSHWINRRKGPELSPLHPNYLHSIRWRTHDEPIEFDMLIGNYLISCVQNHLSYRPRFISLKASLSYKLPHNGDGLGVYSVHVFGIWSLISFNSHTLWLSAKSVRHQLIPCWEDCVVNVCEVSKTNFTPVRLNSMIAVYVKLDIPVFREHK